MTKMPRDICSVALDSHRWWWYHVSKAYKQEGMHAHVMTQRVGWLLEHNKHIPCASNCRTAFHAAACASKHLWLDTFYFGAFIRQIENIEIRQGGVVPEFWSWNTSAAKDLVFGRLRNSFSIEIVWFIHLHIFSYFLLKFTYYDKNATYFMHHEFCSRRNWHFWVCAGAIPFMWLQGLLKLAVSFIKVNFCNLMQQRWCDHIYLILTQVS